MTRPLLQSSRLRKRLQRRPLSPGPRSPSGGRSSDTPERCPLGAAAQRTRLRQQRACRRRRSRHRRLPWCPRAMRRTRRQMRRRSRWRGRPLKPGSRVHRLIRGRKLPLPLVRCPKLPLQAVRSVRRGATAPWARLPRDQPSFPALCALQRPCEQVPASPPDPLAPPRPPPGPARRSGSAVPRQPRRAARAGSLHGCRTPRKGKARNPAGGPSSYRCSCMPISRENGGMG
jgi:hypothetical protein